MRVGDPPDTQMRRPAAGYVPEDLVHLYVDQGALHYLQFRA